VNASEVKNVAVIGAGTMGAIIAGEFARVGRSVRLVDVSQEALSRGFEILQGAQRGQVEAGLTTPRRAAAALKRVKPMVELEAACAGVQLLVEAVSEDLALKRKMFRLFDAYCPKRAILATNTSGLSITRIAGATDRPSRVAGMHFWNPPHVIPLVEVTKGKKTSHTTAGLLMKLARLMGKQPILVKCDVPGFVGNRLQFAVMREALHLLAEGVASAEDIDTAMTAGPGLRYGLLGPLRTADLGGLDVFNAISSYLFADLNADRGPSPALEALIARGKLGAKSGQGFYRYAKRDLQQILDRRDRVLTAFLKARREG